MDVKSEAPLKKYSDSQCFSIYSKHSKLVPHDNESNGFGERVRKLTVEGFGSQLLKDIRAENN